MHLFIVVVTFLSWLTASPAYAGDKYYLNSIHEGLRLEPEGGLVGQIYQGIEVEKIGEERDWTKVSLTGWLKTIALSTQPPQTKEYRSPLEIVNLEDRFSEHGDYLHILGEVKNNGPKDYKFLLVTVTFYDQDRKIVDTTTTIIPSLKGREVKPFKTISKSYEIIRTYKAQVEELRIKSEE